LVESLRLSDSEARYWVNASPLGVAMLDTNMRYIAASKKWCRWAHVASFSELIGRYHYDVFSDLPGHWIAAHRKALAGESVSHPAEAMTKRDGTRVWIGWTVRPWWTETGEIGGISIVRVEMGPLTTDAPANTSHTLEQATGCVGRCAVRSKSILVVAETRSTGSEIVDYLQGLGAQPVGPYTEINAALDEIERQKFDAALLDTELQGAIVFPVADELTRKSVPIIFLAGKDPALVPRRLSASPVLRKPVHHLELRLAFTDN